MTKPKTKHKTLGAVVGPDSTQTRFKLRRRMPHWLPDQLDHSAPCGGDLPGGPPTNPTEEVLYPEEVLSEDPNIRFQKFELDPRPSVSAGLEWILGKDPTSSHAFDGRLLTLQQLLRAYNLALHELRRLHLEVAGVPNASGMTQRGPNATPAEAEANWKTAVEALSTFLGPAGEGKDMTLDVVELNKYIVSVRVVEVKAGSASAGSYQPAQIGGSSSSHIHIPFP